MTTARRLQPFGVTIFTEMTSLANASGAINLGQGFPDWEGAVFAKEAAARSMERGEADQYPPSAGIPELRRAVADRYARLLGRPVDPDTEVTITCGCTEALTACFLGLVDTGDEVVIIEPYYDSYPVGIAMAGAVPRHVTLRPPSFALDVDQLRSVFNERTRAIVVNTPHNPTGRVLTSDELETVADLCVEHDVIAICDEVYEEITFGTEHLRLATLPGMTERTVTLSSVGKTFSLTGWKVGWAVAPQPLTAGVRAAHQYMTFTTPTPVQHGTVAALSAPASFYKELRNEYLGLRDLLAEGLAEIGFEVHLPEGTYFLLAGYWAFSDADDRGFARMLTTEYGVATVPPGVFYHDPTEGHGLTRFAFCKRAEILEEAVKRLRRLRS
ncbi:MAG: aminotransferase class I/II-fold pyridoxal phosphate-dependent enzyme [Actinobacteria bacterium]|nr:aminotransferase class I/II-fold pyridoxal phosphate-dependent enzyme [Actinomycetota bacterium]